MPAIVIVVNEYAQYDSDDSNMTIGGTYFCAGTQAATGSGGGSWSAVVPIDALASTINAAIKDAAIAAAAGYEITVGAQDKKTIIGGAVGL